MPTRVYPFIDIAVLDQVRPHFLAGDAVVILTVELDTVVWANGTGAVLLGYQDIEVVRGAASNLGLASRRQISGTPGFPRIGRNRSLLVRVTQRLSSHAVGFLASEITLPGGAHAIMLVAPDFDAEKRSAQDVGARVIHGIGEAGHFSALIDGEGSVIASSVGFETRGPDRDALAELAEDVALQGDRLVKRLLPLDGMAYPVGVARLSEDPPRHLVIVVDDPQPLPVQVRDAPGAIVPPVPVPPRPSPARTPVQPSMAASDSDSWYFDDQPAPAATTAARLGTVVPEELGSARDAALPEDRVPTDEFDPPEDQDGTEGGFDPASVEPAATVVDLPPTIATVADVTADVAAEEDEPAAEQVDTSLDEMEERPPLEAPDLDDDAYDFDDTYPELTDLPDLPALPQYFELPPLPEELSIPVEIEPLPGYDPDGGETAQDAPVEAEEAFAESAEEDAPESVDDDAVFRPDFRSGPVRFVWRTDALGRFSTVSEEFGDSVGTSAADILGKPFRDVAARFGLDPDGEIAGLLERRDTWSGKSVMWPIEGTDLKVPVDLAALPVYSRDRSFEGFRGFGVVRIGDAVIDEEAIGLSLGKRRHEPSAPSPAAAPEEPQDPFAGEAPAIAVDSTPERRQTDKIIRLAERRPVASDRMLSPTEKIAFREIGARLKDAGADLGPADAPVDPAAAAQDDTAADQPDPDAADFERRLHADELPDPDQDDDWRDRAPSDVEPDGLIEDSLDDDEPEPDEVVRPNGPAQVPESAFDDEETGVDMDADAPDGDNWPRPVPAADNDEHAPPADPDGDGEAAPAARSVDTSILERLPVPVLIHAGDRLHFANQEFLDLTGYVSLLEFEQAGGLDALFVDEDESLGSDPDDHRRRMRTRNGDEFPVDARLQSVPWQGGKALLLALRTTVPAPPEAATVEELAELESRVTEMSTILDTATDGIVIIGNDGTIRSISRPAEALFGFDTAEVAGKPFSSLFAVESQRAARDYLSGLSDNGVASVLNDGREVIGRESQGRFIPLFMTIGRLPGAKGFCAVLRDITQWKRAEEELTQARAEAERASSQKTEFLARISHEIRTPLNAIIGFSELMIDEKFGPIVNDRYRDYLRDINRSGNHVLDLVNDLLDISKIEAGEQEMSYEAVSLNETVAETVAMMQPQANRNRVIIRSSFASRLPDVVADLRSIRQIALNLLSNAVRYTQAGGQVIVSTSYEPTGDVVLRVRDTGVGMSQGEIEQALKPFKQINALKRPRGDGTGLGLPLTKAMVEANRARFAISSAPGEGTMVEIMFPSQRVLAG